MPRHDWVVVIRRLEGPDPAQCFYGRNPLAALLEARKAYASVSGEWTQAMCEYVQDKYLRVPAREIAKALTRMSGMTITKNAVISKAHKMGLGKHNDMASAHMRARLDGVPSRTNAGGPVRSISEAADS